MAAPASSGLHLPHTPSLDGRIRASAGLPGTERLWSGPWEALSGSGRGFPEFRWASGLTRGWWEVIILSHGSRLLRVDSGRTHTKNALEGL